MYFICQLSNLSFANSPAASTTSKTTPLFPSAFLYFILPKAFFTPLFKIYGPGVTSPKPDLNSLTYFPHLFGACPLPIEIFPSLSCIIVLHVVLRFPLSSLIFSAINFELDFSNRSISSNFRSPTPFFFLYTCVYFFCQVISKKFIRK